LDVGSRDDVFGAAADFAALPINAYGSELPRHGSVSPTRILARQHTATPNARKRAKFAYQARHVFDGEVFPAHTPTEAGYES